MFPRWILGKESEIIREETKIIFYLVTIIASIEMCPWIAKKWKLRYILYWCIFVSDLKDYESGSERDADLIRDTPVDSSPFEAHRYHTQIVWNCRRKAVDESCDLSDATSFFRKHGMASKLILQIFCGPRVAGIRRSSEFMVCHLSYRALFGNQIARPSIKLIILLYAMAILFSPSSRSIRKIYGKEETCNHWGHELSVTSLKSPKINESAIEVLWSISYIGKSPYLVSTLVKSEACFWVDTQVCFTRASGNRKSLAVSYDLPPQLNDVYFTIKLWICEADKNRDLPILPIRGALEGFGL